MDYEFYALQFGTQDQLDPPGYPSRQPTICQTWLKESLGPGLAMLTGQVLAFLLACLRLWSVCCVVQHDMGL